MRKAQINRNTLETEIKLSLEILSQNEKGKFSGTSGIGFFDHMLNSFAYHGGFNIDLSMKGDLYVDGHHTVEDVGIVLGKAFLQAVGDMKGIKRFAGVSIPMDEALAFCAIDFSGRPYLHFDAEFSSNMIGMYDTQLTKEFFRAFSQNAGMTLHLRCLYGENDHHKAEALYKAAARAISEALTINSDQIPSSKGVIL